MSLGFPEMLFLAVLALLLVGPRKLPEIARQIGRAVAEFRRATAAFQSHVQQELQGLDSDGSVSDLRNALTLPGSLVPDFKTRAFEMLMQSSPSTAETAPQGIEAVHPLTIEAPAVTETVAQVSPSALLVEGDHA